MRTILGHEISPRLLRTLGGSERRSLKIRAVALAAALIISGGALIFSGDQWDAWDARLTDRIALMHRQPQPGTVEDGSPVVAIDSIFYFDRSHHAQVIENLTAMGVSAQVTDHIFDNKVDPRGDGLLIQASQQAGNVYFGMSFGVIGNGQGRTSEPAAGVESLPADTRWRIRVDGDHADIVSGRMPQVTYPELATAAHGTGFVDTLSDADGVVRRAPLLVRHGDGVYPSLAFRVACDRLGVEPGDIRLTPGHSIALERSRHRGAKIVIPIDARGNMLLNFIDVVPQAKKYSYREIIQASNQTGDMAALKNELAGKIVILSETVEKPYKIRSAQPEVLFPRVAIHKAVIENILAGAYLIPMPRIYTWLVIAALLAAMLLVSLRASSLMLLAVAGSMAAAYAGAGMLGFHSANLVFQFARPALVASSALAALLMGMGVEKAMRAAETERAKRKAEHELKIGREIQSGFFPTRLPEVADWEVNVYFQAARYVAGDFYDIFRLGSQRRIGIVTADVCDKGVGAALFMALFRSFIRVLSGRAVKENFLENGAAAPEVLEKTFQSINDYISITHEQAAMFATVFYGILDASTGDLHYINGGHEPPVIVNGKQIKAQLSPTGTAVGLKPDQAYQLGHAVMEPGDTLVVYTDGIVDALDRSGRPFTKQRFHELLQQPFSSAEALIENIKSEISHHIKGADQYDDITVTVIRRQQVAKDESM